MYIVKAVIVVRAVSILVYALIAFKKLGFKGPNNYLYIFINDIYAKKYLNVRHGYKWLFFHSGLGE